MRTKLATARGGHEEHMTTSTEQGGPIRWTLDLALHGVREPVASAGSFATLEEAMAEAARRDGQQLTWRPPDPSYLGWMAAGQEGWWLIQGTEAERSEVARKGARRCRDGVRRETRGAAVALGDLARDELEAHGA